MADGNNNDEIVNGQILAEVCRIVDSPYPSSLKGLDGLLCQITAGVQTWALHLPTCRLHALADRVIEALPLWPYALDLLRKLLASPTFRDAVLRQDILAPLLGKAVSSESDFDKYRSICVLLLSGTKGCDFALPASSQTFFLQCFDCLTRCPSLATLLPVHELLASGACHDLIGLLPQDAVQQLEQNAKKILQTRKTPSPDNRKFDLYTVDLLCLVSSHRQSGVQSTTTSRKSLADALFNPTNAAKQIDLVNSNVIDACKNEDQSTRDAVARIQAARRVIAFAGTSKILEWRSTRSNNATVLFTKLLQHVTRIGQMAEVQGEALAYISTLADPSQLPYEIVEALQRQLVSLHSVTSISLSWLGPTVATFTPRLKPDDFLQVLDGIFKYLSSSPRLRDVRHAVGVTSALTIAASLSPESMSLISKSFSSSSIQALFTAFETSCKSHACMSASNEHSVCLSAIFDERRLACLAVVTLLLKSQISDSEQSSGTTQGLLLRLIDLQAELGKARLACSHETSVAANTPKLLMLEQQCTQRGSQPLAWRQRLAMELDAQNKAQHRTLVQAMGEICRDLEERCLDVEEPLRVEQEKTKEHEEKCAKLLRKVNDLENQINDKTFVVTGLESELTESEVLHQTLLKENQELSSTLESLRFEMKQALSDAEATFRQLEEKSDQEIMNLRATLSAREDIIQDQSNRFQTIEQELLVSRKRSNELEEIGRELKEIEEILHAEQERFSVELGESQQNLVQCKEELQEASKESAKLHESVKAARSETLHQAEGHKKEIDTLRNEHENDRHTIRDEMDRAVSEYRTQEEKLAGQVSDLRSQLEDTIQELEDHKANHEDAQREQLREMDSKNEEISDLQAQIESISEECSRRDLQIDQYETWQQQLLSMMPGAAGTRVQGTVGLSLKSKRGSRDSPPKNVRRSQCLPEGPHVADANTSFSSASSQNGPTPKRAKPRKSFKVPMMRPTKPLTPQTRRSVRRQVTKPEIFEDDDDLGEDTDMTPSRSTARAVHGPFEDVLPLRPALLDVSSRGNQSPDRRVNFPSAKHGTAAGTAKAIEISCTMPTGGLISFDASGVFTSTPLTPATGVANVAMREGLWSETADEL